MMRLLRYVYRYLRNFFNLSIVRASSDAAIFQAAAVAAICVAPIGLVLGVQARDIGMIAIFSALHLCIPPRALLVKRITDDPSIVNDKDKP